MAGLVVPACATTTLYVEPGADQPHGILKIQMAYHAAAGTHLEETILIDGASVTTPPPAVDPNRAYTRALRVTPGARVLSFGTAFVHYVTRMVTQHYTEYQQRPCGVQTSGYGSSSRTTTRYCSHAVQRTRIVPQTDRVIDASCGMRGPLTVPAGDEILLRYDFLGHGQCSVRCFRQVRRTGGGFALEPCGVLRGG
jgi:hypothetical protein